MKTTLAFLFVVAIGNLMAQPLSYTDSRGNTQLAGPIEINHLQEGDYLEWFQKGYQDFAVSDARKKWSKQLKDVEVEVYLGTWCGDSKRWVPRFVKLWDDLGLQRAQLKLTTLYNGTERYKQGPNGEEIGKNIHRVPTFIFKREGMEFARIVEFPGTDLETDIAQIALGYAPSPSYPAASYVQNLVKEQSMDEIGTNWKTHVRAVYHLVGKPSELNTLGYVFLRSGRIEEAVLTFRLNQAIYPFDPNIHDSLAEGLEASGDLEAAIESYEKALSLNPKNTHAEEKLAALRGS